MLYVVVDSTLNSSSEYAIPIASLQPVYYKRVSVLPMPITAMYMDKCLSVELTSIPYNTVQTLD